MDVIRKQLARFGKQLAKFIEWRRYRRSLQPLAEASDRELKDLGLSRRDSRPPGVYDDWTSL